MKKYKVTFKDNLISPIVVEADNSTMARIEAKTFLKKYARTETIDELKEDKENE